MSTKERYSKLLAHFMLMLWVGMAWTSCSEDIATIDEAGKAETYSVTFHISGLDGQLHTRAEEIVDVDFTKYTAKLYLFSGNKSTGTASDNPYDGFTFVGNPEEGGDKSQPITIDDNGYVTLRNLQSGQDYIYAIVAYEDDYETEGTVKVFNSSTYFLDDLAENSQYDNCCIAALDETNYCPYSKKGEDYFMVYGAGGEVPTLNDSFTPVEIILTRQMGAVVFNTGASTTDVQATCSVFTDYYRLYLSQMVEANTNGTRNHCDDYASYNSYPIYSQTFEGGSQITESLEGYMMYLPCTTTKAFGSTIPENEKANYDGAGNYNGYIETSIKIGGKTYSTTDPFPIYPNRRTILTIGDGSTINVSFGSENNPINQEGDWNGGL